MGGPGIYFQKGVLGAAPFYLTEAAITSISTSTPFGNLDASIVLRAGLESPKYSALTFNLQRARRAVVCTPKLMRVEYNSFSLPG